MSKEESGTSLPETYHGESNKNKSFKNNPPKIAVPLDNMNPKGAH